MNGNLSLLRNSIFCTTLLFFSTIHSQEKKEILNSTLWIKAPSVSEEMVNNSLNNGNGLKNYFNFNPVVNFAEGGIRKNFKNIVKKETTLFVVIKSPSKEEGGILEIEKGGDKTYFTNQKIQSDKDLILNKGISDKGMIVNYACNKNSILTRKNGNITIDDLFYQDREAKNLMMELLYFPRYLTEADQNLVESYLSVKYGISLQGEKDYYNSEKVKVWEFKNNKDYNYRVTGIGKDDVFGLLQKQSGNYEKDGLYVGFDKIEKTNSANKSKIENKSYLLWGDNNGSTFINESEGNYKKMKRVWKTQSYGKLNTVYHTQVVLNKKEMIVEDLNTENPINNNAVWMAIDTTGNASFNFKAAYYIKSETIENNLVFNNVAWKSNTSSLFSFVKASDFIVKEETITPDCSLGQYAKSKISIIGGNAPFKVRLSAEGFSKEYNLDGTYLEVDQLKDGNYQLEVTDATLKTQRSSFTVDGFSNNTVSLVKQWILGSEGSVIVKPTIENADFIKSYEWYFNNKLISTENEVTVNDPGDYNLVLTNENNCAKTYDFNVEAKGAQGIDDWKLYPNPTKANEDFTVNFTLEKPKKVSVALLDMDGKIIKKTDLGEIQQFEYRDNLHVSGTYLVIITIDGASSAGKLIIQ